MSRSFIVIAAITLASVQVFGIQYKCIGYCQSGTAAPTGVRATGSNQTGVLQALQAATTSLRNLCASPKVLSNINCAEVGAHQTGLATSNYANAAQAQSSAFYVGGTRPNRVTQPYKGGGLKNSTGNDRKDSAY